MSEPTHPTDSGKPRPTVAILGAGIAGLTCARELHEAGLRVDVFDKSRGTGGRVSTRRTDTNLQFDHGAQYFTVKGRALRRHVDFWVQDRVADEWTPKLAVIDAKGVRSKRSTEKRYVGRPSMSALTRHLARGLDVHYNARACALQRHEEGWTLEFEETSSDTLYDIVVSTLPAPQAAELFADVASSMAARAARVDFAPTWALMVDFEAPLPVDFDAAFVNDGPLSWIAREGSKPGRPRSNAWVVHAGADWSREFLELPAELAQEKLLGEFERTLVRKVGVHTDLLPPASYARAHRWRYARATPALDRGCLVDANRGLIFAGDWLNGSRVEGAFESGLQAAQWILSR